MQININSIVNVRATTSIFIPLPIQTTISARFRIIQSNLRLRDWKWISIIRINISVLKTNRECKTTSIASLRPCLLPRTRIFRMEYLSFRFWTNFSWLLPRLDLILLLLKLHRESQIVSFAIRSCSTLFSPSFHSVSFAVNLFVRLIVFSSLKSKHLHRLECSAGCMNAFQDLKSCCRCGSVKLVHESFRFHLVEKYETKK